MKCGAYIVINKITLKFDEFSGAQQISKITNTFFFGGNQNMVGNGRNGVGENDIYMFY